MNLKKNIAHFFNVTDKYFYIINYYVITCK
jgi:hypothetical protein